MNIEERVDYIINSLREDVDLRKLLIDELYAVRSEAIQEALNYKAAH
jgi:hypothetical protein